MILDGHQLQWALVSGRRLDAGDRDLRDRIEQAVSQVCADLGITTPAGHGESLPAVAELHRKKPGS